jgi:GT2 family glycosyltransferase
MAEGVTAAIINWNGGDMVLKCLRSLLAQQRPPDELVVIDNGSADGSLERLQAEHPGIKVQRNATNQGFARAANQAVEAATRKWLLLANLDVEFESDYIARLLAAGESDDRIGSVTGKLLRPRSSAGLVVDSTGHILYRNGWAANRGEGEIDSGQWETAGEVFGVTAAAALYRMSMLADVCEGDARPFDERFFAYIEDVDLDWRMRWLGWKAWYEPAVAWHFRSATGLRRAAFILRHILKNRLLLVGDNDLWPQGLLRLPGVLAFTGMTAVQFAMESRRAPLGVFDALPHIGSSLRRRRFLRRRRQVAAQDVSKWMEPFPYRQKIARKLRAGARRAAAGS